MAENSKIQWTHHTFNPWRGCTKVSEGCQYCYAETMSKRNPGVLGEWGVRGTRVIASESAWKEPLKWNRKASEAGERHRVFCASLADVFEGPETLPQDSVEAIREARFRLYNLIDVTPNLDWLLLTKRPERVVSYQDWLKATRQQNVMPSHVWIGTSVETQARADQRIPLLSEYGEGAAVRFLSVEPLLDSVSLSYHLRSGRINWVIVGGESGPNARSCDTSWVRRIVNECSEFKVPCFVKQLGSNPAFGGTPLLNAHLDSKGSNLDSFPHDLRVREFPTTRR